MKRLFSILIAIAVFVSGIPISVWAESSARLQVGIISDIHYFPAGLTGNYCAAFNDYALKNTRQEAQSDALLESALYALAKHARQNGMKYLLLPGDNSRDGEYFAHQKLAERLEKFERETGIQVIVTNGNHDINNTGAATFENGVKENARRTSPENWLYLYRNLGFDLAYHTFKPSEGKKGGMLSYSVKLDGDYRLIVMDSCKYSRDNTSDGEDQHEGEGKYSDELMNWILTETADARACGEEVIGMTHHSLVPHFEIEPTVMPTLTLDNWLEASEALAAAGMRYVLTGHMHMNDVATGTEDGGATITDIATASLSGYPNTFKEVLFDHSNGGFSAGVKTYDVDCEKPVAFLNIQYEQPYKNTFSFGQSFGHDGLGQYGADMANQVVSEYLDKAKQQGLLGMLKGMGIDVGDMVSDFIGSGFTIGKMNIFSSKNVLGIINDLAMQIESNYVNNPERVQAIIEKAINKLAAYKVSEIPCTKFFDSLGFGNAGRGGDFEEFGMSLMVYMFAGDEDLHDDAFMSDVLENFKNGEFTTRLVEVLTQIILDDLLENELLSTFQINISSVFTCGITRETLGAFLDFMLRAILGGDASYESLIEFMLKLGAVPQKNVGKLIDSALNIYMDASGLDKTLAFWLGSLLADNNPGLKNDSNVKLNWSGPVEVIPTEDSNRLPVQIEITNVNDNPASKKITWYTKYSVTGTDIEIIPYSKNPVFTGVPLAGNEITVKSESVNRTFHALELTGLKLFPYKLNQNIHTVELSNLEVNGRYLYRAGDAAKGWWSPAGEFDTYSKTSGYEILNLTQSQLKDIIALLPVVMKVFESVEHFGKGLCL